MDIVDAFFDWTADTINAVYDWLSSLSLEELARQLLQAIYKLVSRDITTMMAMYSHSIEVSLLSLLLAPLFLINMVTASVDIFAGITPIYQTDGNNAISLYQSSPQPIYMIDKGSLQKIPLFSDYDLLPPFPFGPEVENETDADLIAVKTKVQGMWRELIQSNPDVVMNAGKGYSSPDRYYPNVRAFIQENQLGFGTNSMYYALANAMLNGAAVGSGVAADSIPQMTQIPLDILRKSEEMPTRLTRPIAPYNDENFLLLETAAIEGLYIAEPPYLTELELDEDLEEITLELGNYLKVSGYEVVYTYIVETENDEGEVVSETVTIIKYMNTYLHQLYYNVYQQLFADLQESGWVKPQSLAERIVELRDNPDSKNNQELADLLSLPIISGEVMAQMYTEANPYLWTNEYILTAPYVRGDEAQAADAAETASETIAPAETEPETEIFDDGTVKGKDIVRYFSLPANGYGLSFYARYDRELKTMTGFTAINSFYTVKELWVDFIQNNRDLVYNPLLPYHDINRYMPVVQQIIRNTGVRPGSEEMYATLADSIYHFVLVAGEKPVNRWVDPNYVNAYNLKVRPEKAYYSSSLNLSSDITLPQYILSSETLRTAFWGITLVSMVLCLAFSIYAITHSMGDLTLQRPVGKVMGLAAKSMLTFLIMPAFCACAVYLSSAVLAQMNYLIDSGGDSGNPVSVTGAMFYAAVTPSAVLLPGEPSSLLSSGISEKGKWVVKGPDSPELRQARIEYYETLRSQYLSGTKSISPMDIDKIRKDFDAIKLVANGYLIVMSLAAWVLLVLMIMVLIVFLRRIFDIVMLYLTAPLFVSTIPLDDGHVFRGWREKFVGAVVMGFGSLITFKLVLLLLPLIWDPKLYLHPGTVINNIMKAILTLGGMFAAFKSHTLIASMISQHGEEAEAGAMSVAMEPAHQAKQMANTVKNQATMGIRQLTHKGLDKITGKNTGAGSRNQSYLYSSKDKSSSSKTETKKDDSRKKDKSGSKKDEGNKADGNKPDGNKSDSNKSEDNKSEGKKAKKKQAKNKQNDSNKF